MSDLISRQAAIDALDEWESGHSWDAWCYEHKDEAKKFHIYAPTAVIENLPSAQPEWIPCSERLPYPWDEEYLVTLAWGGVGVMEYKSTGFHNYGSFSPVPLDAVTAWMPKPKPYRKENRCD